MSQLKWRYRFRGADVVVGAATKQEALSRLEKMLEAGLLDSEWYLVDISHDEQQHKRKGED